MICFRGVGRIIRRLVGVSFFCFNQFTDSIRDALVGFEYWSDPNDRDSGSITWQVDGQKSHPVPVLAAAVALDHRTERCWTEVDSGGTDEYCFEFGDVTFFFFFPLLPLSSLPCFLCRKLTEILDGRQRTRGLSICRQ